MIKLNPKRRAFAEHYVNLGNATAAALKAGYAASTAQGYSYDLLADENVQRYIKQLEASMLANLSDKVATKQDILIFLTNTMNGIDSVESLDGIEVINPVPRRDRIRAAELLGKYYDMFTETKDTAVANNITININDGS